MPRKQEQVPRPLDLLDLMNSPPQTDESLRNSEMGPGLRNLGEIADMATRKRAIDSFDKIMHSACSVGAITTPNLTAAREIITSERLDPPGIRKMSRFVQSLVKRGGIRWHSQGCIKTFLKLQRPSTARAAYFLLKRINRLCAWNLELPVTAPRIASAKSTTTNCVQPRKLVRWLHVAKQLREGGSDDWTLAMIRPFQAFTGARLRHLSRAKLLANSSLLCSA